MKGWMMKRSMEVYAYKFSDEWHLSENKRDDLSMQPEKVKMTFVSTVPPDTKRWLRHALRSGLTVQSISTDDVNFAQLHPQIKTLRL